MNPYGSPKKMRLSNLKAAYSPEKSIPRKKEIYVNAHIIADNDIAVVYAYNPKKSDFEPFTHSAKVKIEKCMGSNEESSLTNAGFFACVLRVASPDTDTPKKNSGNWEWKAFVARAKEGRNFLDNPKDLKNLVQVFCDVSLFFEKKLYYFSTSLYI